MSDPKAAPLLLPSGDQLPRPPEALLRLPDVLRLAPLSKTTFYALMKKGVAPAPVHIGRSALWRYGDVLAFISRDPAELGEQLRAARDTEADAKRKP